MEGGEGQRRKEEERGVRVCARARLCEGSTKQVTTTRTFRLPRVGDGDGLLAGVAGGKETMMGLVATAVGLLAGLLAGLLDDDDDDDDNDEAGFIPPFLQSTELVLLSLL